MDELVGKYLLIKHVAGGEAVIRLTSDFRAYEMFWHSSELRFVGARFILESNEEGLKLRIIKVYDEFPKEFLI